MNVICVCDSVWFKNNKSRGAQALYFLSYTRGTGKFISDETEMHFPSHWIFHF